MVGPVANNVFIVRCRRSGDALLIDAANEHELLLDLCRRLGVRTVVETHGHWDHIQAIPAVRDAGYEVAVTALDAPRLADVGYDLYLDDDQVLEVGDVRVRTILTPGHTEGSICSTSRAPPLLFTGDTLFPGGPGNTSFEGGDFDAIITSIDNRLFTFPDDTLILPGHGLDSTIGTERPQLPPTVARGWWSHSPPSNLNRATDRGSRCRAIRDITCHRPAPQTDPTTVAADVERSATLDVTVGGRTTVRRFGN